MSKYNHIKSIPIESIPKEELKQAIKEWAEGSEEMEKLLWACYNNGLKTSGCHAGPHPYISFNYEKEQADLFRILINAVLKESNSQLLVRVDGGNPLSGPDWYKPNIGLGSNDENRDDVEKLLSTLTTKLNNKYQEDVQFNSIINLTDFLSDKLSGLLIRVKNSPNDGYVFSIEKSIHPGEENTFEELNNLLTSAGSTYVESDMPIKFWEFKENDIVKFAEKLEDICNNIINNYSLKKPEKLEDSNNLNIRAHLKREEFIKEGNESNFELWLMAELDRIDKEYEQLEQERSINK